MRLVYLGRFAIVAAAPQVTFPFNSQIPPAARVAQTYDFKFAAATFQGSGKITYDLVDAPAWLKLDTQRTLSGTPGDDDRGSQTFGLRAVDSTGSTISNCTVMVSDQPAPRVQEEAENQLARSGKIVSPGTLAVYPGDAFTIQFDSATFSTDSGDSQASYARLADRTPLPSWIGFNPAALSFFGIAPAARDESQSYSISLIASDVSGYSGAETSFTLRVSNHQLLFSPQSQEYAVGGNVGIDLSKQIYLDSNPLPLSQIVSSTIFGPEWLSLDSATLAVSGRSPSGFTKAVAGVTVQDRTGNLAQKTLILQNGNISGGMDSSSQPQGLPDPQIANASAKAGQTLAFILPPELFQVGLSQRVDMEPEQPWLEYKADAHQIEGDVPDDIRDSSIKVNILLSDGSQVAVRSFYVNISGRTSSASPPASTNSSGLINSSPETGLDSAHPYLDARQVAGIVIGLLAAVILFAFLIGIWCRRKRKRRTSIDKIDKSDISRPLAELSGDWYMQNAAEAAIEPVPPVENVSKDTAPQIHLELSDSPLKVAPLRMTRMSTASSLGAGESAIRADENIPVLGSSRRHGLHDSYSAAARLSGLTCLQSHAARNTLTSNHASRRSAVSPLSSDPSLQHGYAVSKLQHPLDAVAAAHSSSDALPGSTSDPSTDTTDQAVSVIIRPESGVMPQQRQSVRLVPSSSRVSYLSRASTSRHRISRISSIDPRPLTDKRHSFVRRARSSNVPSPLFASANKSQRLKEHPPGLFGCRERNCSTFSESSSLDPSPSRNQSGASPCVIDTVEGPVPSSPVADDRSSQYSTIQGTPTDDGLADFTTEAALPRHQRSFVLPGEASPTPPPSAIPANRTDRSRMEYYGDGREASRRRLAKRLQRNSKGQLVTTSSLLASEVSELDVIEPSVEQPSTVGSTQELWEMVKKDSLGSSQAKAMKKGRAKGKSGHAKEGAVEVYEDGSKGLPGPLTPMERVMDLESKSKSSPRFI